jgi:hypothetical protein
MAVGLMDEAICPRNYITRLRTMKSDSKCKPSLINEKILTNHFTFPMGGTWNLHLANDAVIASQTKVCRQGDFDFIFYSGDWHYLLV